MATVLYIDSEKEGIKRIKEMLNKKGHNVTAVCNERRCLVQIKESRPDLVLINVMSPNVIAWDLYQKIREINNKTKVAFISSIPITEERKQDLIMSGISGYIMKPFTKEELLKSVKTILS